MPVSHVTFSAEDQSWAVGAVWSEPLLEMTLTSPVCLRQPVLHSAEQAGGLEK